VAPGAARCRRCGSPLRITPETIIAVCSQCGFPNWTSQAFIHPVEIVPARTGKIVESFRERVRSDPFLARLEEKIAVKSVETLYIPVYVTRVEASTQYEGIATVTLVRGRGGVEEAETFRPDAQSRKGARYVTVRVKGRVAREYVLPLPAVRVTETRIVEPLISSFMERNPSSKPLTSVDWEEVKGQVLPVEVTPQDAMVWARDEACERLQSEVESLMQKEAEQKAVAVSPGWRPDLVVWSRKRAPCRAEDRGLSPIILVPLVTVYYNHDDSVYKALFAGWDGSIIAWNRPFKPYTGRVPLAGAVLISGLLGGAGAALTVAGDPLAGALLLLTGAGGASALAWRAYDQRISGTGG